MVDHNGVNFERLKNIIKGLRFMRLEKFFRESQLGVMKIEMRKQKI